MEWVETRTREKETVRAGRVSSALGSGSSCPEPTDDTEEGLRRYWGVEDGWTEVSGVGTQVGVRVGNPREVRSTGVRDHVYPDLPEIGGSSTVIPSRRLSLRPTPSTPSVRGVVTVPTGSLHDPSVSLRIF